MIAYVDGKNVNLEMIKAGLAEVYQSPPAKGLEMEPYRQAEAEAKKDGIGIWSLGVLVSESEGIEEDAIKMINFSKGNPIESFFGFSFSFDTNNILT